MDYLLHILILIAIYSTLASSLNLVTGYCGFVSVAHATFFAVGAYTTALLALRLGTPLAVNVVAAMLASCLIGLVVALPSLRGRGDFFVIASFAVQIIASNVLNNWTKFTGGPMGLPGIPQPQIAGFVLGPKVTFLLLAATMLAAALWALRRLARSPFGRVLQGIREDEQLIASMGKHTLTFKLRAFVVAAAIAGVAGSLFAYYFRFVDPSSFSVMESIFILTIVILGGAGSLAGPPLGAIILVSISELIRLLPIAGMAAANVRQIIYGGLLLGLAALRPRGLLGRYGFGR